MTAYQKTTTYRFTSYGVKYAIVEFDENSLSVEETRKNGQEDTHFSAELYIEDDTWRASDYDMQHSNDYGDLDRVLDYLNANPFSPEPI